MSVKAGVLPPVLIKKLWIELLPSQASVLAFLISPLLLPLTSSASHPAHPARQKAVATGSGIAVFRMKGSHYNPIVLRPGLLNPCIRAHQHVYEMLCRVEVLREKLLTETVLAGKAQIKRFHLHLSADAYYNQRNTWRDEYKDITDFIKGSLLNNTLLWLFRDV